MTEPSATPVKSPMGRLIALAVLVLVGVGLFFFFAPRTSVIARAADSETSP